MKITIVNEEIGNMKCVISQTDYECTRNSSQASEITRAYKSITLIHNCIVCFTPLISFNTANYRRSRYQRLLYYSIRFVYNTAGKPVSYPREIVSRRLETRASSLDMPPRWKNICIFSPLFISSSFFLFMYSGRLSELYRVRLQSSANIFAAPRITESRATRPYQSAAALTSGESGERA